MARGPEAISVHPKPGSFLISSLVVRRGQDKQEALEQYPLPSPPAGCLGKVPGRDGHSIHKAGGTEGTSLKVCTLEQHRGARPQLLPSPVEPEATPAGTEPTLEVCPGPPQVKRGYRRTPGASPLPLAATRHWSWTSLLEQQMLGRCAGGSRRLWWEQLWMLRSGQKQTGEEQNGDLPPWQEALLTTPCPAFWLRNTD